MTKVRMYLASLKATTAKNQDISIKDVITWMYPDVPAVARKEFPFSRTMGASNA